MKKLKLKSMILMGALLLGSGAAGVQAAAKILNDDPVYTWTEFDRDGNPIGSFMGTQSDAESLTGCTGNEEVCATGTAPGEDTIQIKYLPAP